MSSATVQNIIEVHIADGTRMHALERFVATTRYKERILRFWCFAIAMSGSSWFP